jgi:hypothetical protein
VRIAVVGSYLDQRDAGTLKLLKRTREEFERVCRELGMQVAQKAERLSGQHRVKITIFSGEKHAAEYHVVDGIMSEGKKGNIACQVEVIHPNDYPHEFCKWVEDEKLKMMFIRPRRIHLRRERHI